MPNYQVTIEDYFENGINEKLLVVFQIEIDGFRHVAEVISGDEAAVKAAFRRRWSKKPGMKGIKIEVR